MRKFKLGEKVKVVRKNDNTMRVAVGATGEVIGVMGRFDYDYYVSFTDRNEYVLENEIELADTASSMVE